MEYSRRDFIRQTGVGLAGLTLAACQSEQQITAPETISADTVITQNLTAENTSDHIVFTQKSIYEMDMEADHADVVVCCEVLEHLDRPEKALGILKGLKADHYIFSVPREPIWRILNMFRGKYISGRGNTHRNTCSPC